ncbi:hypothetical protein [Streptomyces telluris]|uniref:Uncharacterized protein n=1 Tax=Streptomyces telluris TaxID=2720021 RepID=A0A9X2LC19_9ACTN|nr:hypothetical protein [Streptomyces telluris]MCQ8768423.1 hypothetical protein [Streptomyces telluris]NJP80962.1 hypothetical protein [Streptomyces telluris]
MDPRSSPLARLRTAGGLLLAALTLAGGAVATTTTTTVTVTATTTATGGTDAADPCRAFPAGTCPHRN